MANLNGVLSDCLKPRFEFHSDFCLQDGVYGGLVMAAAIAKVESQAEHPVRTLQLNFSALARPNVETECIALCRRSGSNTQTFDVAFMQGETCVAHGSVFTGRSRNTFPDRLFLDPPNAKSPDNVTAIGPSMPLPPYTKHFVLQPCIGQMILSGGAPMTGGYIQCRDPEVTELGVAHVAALIDAWWPSFFVTTERMRPMGTTSIQVNFNSDALPIKNKPLLLDIKGHFSGGGFGSETNQIWSTDGQLLASAQQCIAIIA
ncbi:MAG: acyl-CoA thioesterase domain-containing protein [Myxococcota bacterium]|nr:acyl-CoA thioesterase domain-containing protein [Myxococcota bacterium]